MLHILKWMIYIILIAYILLKLNVLYYFIWVQAYIMYTYIISTWTLIKNSFYFEQQTFILIIACKLLYNLCIMLVLLLTHRLKTWLRNQISQQRLTSLALMNIHQDIIINVNKIIDRFSKSKRNLDFVI